MCKSTSPYDVFKYCSGSDLNGNQEPKKPTWCWPHTFVDSMVLYDGVLMTANGACCATNGDCAVTSAEACATVNGRFHGSDTTCQEITCCPLPFADADRDGDVDQDDFGAFQLCYTGTVGGVPTGCVCFDRNGDGTIDAVDLESFTDCWTSANVTWTQVLTPDCTP